MRTAVVRDRTGAGPPHPVRLGLVAALGVTAATAMAPVVGERTGLLALTAVAAVAGRVALGRSRPTRTGRHPVGALAGWVAVMALVALPSAALDRGPGAPALVVAAGVVVEGLVHGWALLLVATLPAGADPRLVVGPATVVWVASWWSTDRAMSGPGALGPVLGPVAVVATGAALAGAAERSPAATGAFVALGAATVALGPTTGGAGTVSRLVVTDRRRRVARPVVGALGVLVIAVAATAAATTALGDRRPEPLRSAAQRPPDALPAVSPLVRLARWHDEPRRVLFTARAVAGGDGVTPARWRLAVLDTFDGARWASSAVHRPMPGTIPTPLPPGTMVHEIRLRNLDGPWLPGPDRPVAWDLGADLVGRVDAATGSLLVVDAPSPERPYQVAWVPTGRGDGARLVGEARRRALAVPLPVGDEARRARADLAALARRVTAAEPTPVAAMAGLEAHLQRHFDEERAVGAGHTYGDLRSFLVDTRIGTVDQFAAAFAVLSRLAGRPSRLVVGFVPSASDPANLAARGRDAHVWPEVHLPGRGWVAFEPAPSRPPVDRPGGAVDDAPPSAADAVAVGPASGPDRRPDPTPTGSPVAVLAGPAAVGAGALALLAISGWSARALVTAARRRARWCRRRRGTPSRRVVGAGLEARDRLGRAGLDTTTLTGPELVHAVGERFGPDTAAAVATIEDVAADVLFAGRPATAGTAASVWAAAVIVRRRARRR